MTTTLEATDADYEIVRGDADDIEVTVVSKAKPVVPYDLSKAIDGTADRPSVLRFTVRKTPTATAVLIAKSSAKGDTEIQLLAQSGLTKGKAVIYIDHPDTLLAPSAYAWDFEVTRQGRVRTQIGTVDVVGTAITGIGTAFTDAKDGDVLHFTSGPNINRAVLISTITTDTALVIDPATIVDGAGFSFEIRRGFRRTPLRGAFTVGQEVTR